MNNNVKLFDISNFGVNVFSREAMKKYLSKEDFEIITKNIDDGKALNLGEANTLASALMKWAIDKGATHFTHWFQPLTGFTAEKHESFLNIIDDKPINEFSCHALIKGETDGSSFPSGGLRATFEARGYTVWDPTSNCFVKNNTLYIPTAFCSYGGDSLDKKTPLLRSMEVIGKEASKILSLFGIVDKVIPTVGSEQEYFLIDKKLYDERLDLVVCGRTLFGAKPPKAQELGDHYFGKINKRVSEFMRDVDKQLWELGVPAKTEHNEAAPAQHELAPIFSSNNIETDHNQLTMEIMQSTAYDHGLVCLLHEKPFEGINGSGKHNNWSLKMVKNNKNIFDPGDKPEDNLMFLLFLTSLIQATYKAQGLIRISVASPSNDHRLGGYEAPPAIVSLFLGDDLCNILESIDKEGQVSVKNSLDTGVKSISQFDKDTSDRNRTSPFAFTGSKFELRMVGSKQSIASPNVVINTAVASALHDYYEILKGKPKEELNKAIRLLIKDEYNKYKDIVFNGNCYSEEWVKEAEKRGLKNYKTTYDACIHFKDEDNANLLKRFNVLNDHELESRYEIMLDDYVKQLMIEADTMIKMVRKEILPSVFAYHGDLAKWLKDAKDMNAYANSEYEILRSLANYIEAINSLLGDLVKKAEEIKKIDDTDLDLKAKMTKEELLPCMEKLRSAVDKCEEIVAKDYWSLPDYCDLLYSVKY